MKINFKKCMQITRKNAQNNTTDEIIFYVFIEVFMNMNFPIIIFAQ
jgi:hypothetical protein